MRKNGFEDAGEVHHVIALNKGNMAETLSAKMYWYAKLPDKRYKVCAGENAVDVQIYGKSAFSLACSRRSRAT